MSKIIVHEKAFIPWFQPFPYEETDEWGQTLLESIPETLEKILKGVPDDEHFQKKILEQLIAAVRRMIGRGFVSHTALPQELRIEIVKAKLNSPDASKLYIDCIKLAKLAFDQGELNSAKIAYYLGKGFGPYRFRDAIELTLKLLTPFIQPAKLGKFKKELNNLLMSLGTLITKLAYHPEHVKQANDKINSLINKYLIKGIVPFAPGGESHCDLTPILESITLFYSTRPKEIKYETYKRFISEKNANDLRSRWPVIDESTPPDPNEYIGHPEKPAFFDMNLDVQVSKKTS